MITFDEVMVDDAYIKLNPVSINILLVLIL